MAPGSPAFASAGAFESTPPNEACIPTLLEDCDESNALEAELANSAELAAGLDTSFNSGAGPSSGITDLVVQPDGKTVIVGWFTSYDGTPRNRVARLNADGSLDTTFDPGTGAECIGAPWCAVWSVAIQSDGKILISGDFNRYNGAERIRLARLNADGSLDETFNPGAGTTWAPLSLAIQPDGKIVIAGDFSSYNGTPRNNIARLNANGSLDTTFDPGTGAGPAPGVWRGLVYSVAVQSDGKILIGGEFTRYNGVVRNHIARLNADGSLDTSFDPGTGANGDVGLNSIAIQPDGKIIIVGSFTSIDGTPRNRIARLNANGSLDASLNPGSGANNTVSGVALQSDGKILIGGNFTAFDGTVRNRIARLNVDSTLDGTFDPVGGADQNVGPIAVQSDGGIIIGGDFTSYDGIARKYIARLSGNRPPDPSPSDPGSGGESPSSPPAEQASPSTSEASKPRPVSDGPPVMAPDLVVGAAGSVSVGIVDANGVVVQGGPEVEVLPLQRREGLEVRASGWSVELQGVEESGRPALLNAAGNLEVVQGLGLATSGRGFAPNSQVGLFLFSEPRTLGTLTTDARGVFAGTVPVPADVPVGVHTAQVSGFTPNGDRLIVSLGIEVAAPQADPLISQIPPQVQPLWWLPVTGPGGEVQILAGSSGCSAMDGDGSNARGKSLVFWGIGTCVFEVRSGGKAWRTFQIPIVPKAEKTEDVKQLPSRRIWFTSDNSMTERSMGVLERAMPKLKNASASYAYWLDTRNRDEAAKVSRHHVKLGRELQIQGPVRGIRTIPIPASWRPSFGEGAHRYVLIAWKPRP